MVSITLSVPEEVRTKMNEFYEINWSGYVRKCIIKKTKKLDWKRQMLKKIKKEKELIDWSVELGRTSKRGRFELLKKKGLA